MNSDLVEYLTWFKENEKGMHARNNLASSSVVEPESAIIDLVEDKEFSRRLSLHDPWWHPVLIQNLKQYYRLKEGREVVITNGASGAIWLVFQALLSAGDHVIIERPGYQPLLSAPRFLNAEISLVMRNAENDYQIERQSLEALIRPETKLIVLTNLHNPSGYALNEETLGWLNDVIREHDANPYVLLDETFRDLASGEPNAAANFHDRIISINTLSKAYGLAVLRCGWIISSQTTYEKIRDTFVLVENSGSRLTESIASLVTEDLGNYRRRSRAICAENQKMVQEFMNPLIAEGRIFGRVPSEGCLYFPRIAGMENTDEFVQELQSSWDVYVAPGRFFGASQHIRIGFGGESKYLAGALERLSEAIRSRVAAAHS